MRHWYLHHSCAVINCQKCIDVQLKKSDLKNIQSDSIQDFLVFGAILGRNKCICFYWHTNLKFKSLGRMMNWAILAKSRLVFLFGGFRTLDSWFIAFNDSSVLRLRMRFTMRIYKATFHMIKHFWLFNTTLMWSSPDILHNHFLHLEDTGAKLPHTALYGGHSYPTTESVVFGEHCATLS